MTPDNKAGQDFSTSVNPLKEFSGYMGVIPPSYIPSKRTSPEPPRPQIEYEVGYGRKLTIWFSEQTWARLDSEIITHIEIAEKGIFRLVLTPHESFSHAQSRMPIPNSKYPDSVQVGSQAAAFAGLNDAQREGDC